MRMMKKVVVLLCLLSILLPAFGCSEEGPMEKAGKKMDQAAEDAGNAAKDAGEAAKKLFE